MSDERTNAKPRESEVRCPFCHDAIRDDAASLDEKPVACASCGAPHHAECFVENQSCSATGCGGRSVRLGVEEVPVGVLRARLDEGDLSPRARGPVPADLLLGVGGAFLVIGFVLVLVSPSPATFGAMVLGVVSATLGLAAPSRRKRVRVEPAEAAPPIIEDGALATAFPGVFESADPYEPIRRRIDAEGVRDDSVVPAVAPEKCSACGQALEPSEEPLRFCYHCGAALA